MNPLALSLPLSFLHHHALASEEWSVRPLAGRSVNMAILDGNAIDARKGVGALPPCSRLICAPGRNSAMVR